MPGYYRKKYQTYKGPAYWAAVARNKKLASKSYPKARGRGDYSTTLRKIKNSFKTFGRAIPKGTFQKMGGYMGGSAGADAGRLIQKMTGYGDYTSITNARAGGSGTGRYPVPEFTKGKRSTIVCHREYIQDIYSSATAGAFSLQSFPINPGMSQTFPWLSTVAQNFEEYKIKGMMFEYKSNSADALNSTNTALGTVILATDYNPLNASFTNKQQMENTEFSYSDRPSVDIRHPIECNRRDNPLGEFFVRSNAPSSADYDLRFTDLGNFMIASTGQQGTSVNLGELWVSYEIELLKPILGASTEQPLLSAHYINNGTQGTVATSSPFGSLAFSHQPIQQAGTTLPLTFNVGSQGVIQFPANIETGNYMIIYYLNGTPATLAFTGWTNPVNCTMLSMWNTGGVADAAAQAYGPAPTVSSGLMMVACIISITAPSSLQASIQLVTATIPTSGQYDVFVTQMNSNLLS